MKIHLVTLLVCTLTANKQFISTAAAEADSFTRSEALEDWFNVTWTVNTAAKTIIFDVCAHTLGYVGFGINNIGGMKGADIVVGGVHRDGSSYFWDMHGEGNAEPVLDESQDWELLSAKEESGWTKLRFSRPFNPCDQEHDVQLAKSVTYRVIYSIGQTDELSYHGGNRGVRSIVLMNPPTSKEADVSKFKVWEVRVNTQVPATDTTYWYTFHRSPRFPSKVHVVGYEVKVDTPESRMYTHHAILSRCTPPEGMNISVILDPYIGHPGGVASDPDIAEIKRYCTSFMLRWGKGDGLVLYPEHVGIPAGETSGTEYLMLEVHYDNPRNDTGVQYETGFNIYYTPELRKYDAGLMIVGSVPSALMITPPNVKDFVNAGHCSRTCTSSILPDDGINVIAVNLHAHLHARAIKFRHFRDDRELPWIANDKNADFAYQPTAFITEELKILQGDQLTVECSYDTTWQNPPRATHGGDSTREEMCHGFLLYYPRTQKASFCMSLYLPASDIFEPLGIESVNLTARPDPTVVAPEKWQNMTLLDVMSTKVNWTADLIRDTQYRMRWAPQTGFCTGLSLNDTLHLVSYPNVTDYEPPFECESPKATTTVKPEPDSGNLFQCSVVALLITEMLAILLR